MMSAQGTEELLSPCDHVAGVAQAIHTEVAMTVIPKNPRSTD